MIDFAKVIKTPDEIIPYAKYPSGVKEDESPLYRYAYPDIENPVVRTPFTICNDCGDCIAPGFYEVVITGDRKFLLLMQSKKIAARVPVADFTEKEVKQEPSPVQKTDKKKNTQDKKKKNEKREKEIAEMKKQARLKATLTDSQKGYFILYYSTEAIKAVGFIPY